jgi:hypothetical protein
MLLETLDPKEIKQTWRTAVEKSIRRLSFDELNAIWERLFSDHSHPWSEPFRQLIDKNADGPFFHATTTDQIQFLYCHDDEKGYWFIPGIAIGIMQPSALNVMKEIIKTKLA